MENTGLIAIILICGMFADGLLMKRKLQTLSGRIKDLEKSIKGK
jgi:hypothetical protein